MGQLERIFKDDCMPTPCAALSSRSATITESLKLRQQSLESQLAAVNEAIEAIESVPEIQRVLEAIGKAL